jgi:hypothetical protein
MRFAIAAETDAAEAARGAKKMTESIVKRL